MACPADDIEPALGGALLTLLGDEAAGMRMQGQRQPDHFGRRGHLEIERHEELPLEALHVEVADMPPVLAKMGRDPVRAGEYRQVGGPDRVRIRPPRAFRTVATWSMFTPRRSGGAFIGLF